MQKEAAMQEQHFVLDNIRVTEVTTEPEPSVDKSNLEALVAYAESQKEKAEYEDVVDVVKELFEKTLAEAKTVLEDTKSRAVRGGCCL